MHKDETARGVQRTQRVPSVQDLGCNDGDYGISFHPPICDGTVVGVSDQQGISGTEHDHVERRRCRRGTPVLIEAEIAVDVVHGRI